VHIKVKIHLIMTGIHLKNWNDDYNCWWNIKILPSINKINASYIDFITGEDGVLKHWLKTGIKGYRLDVADELPNEF